MKQNPVIIEAPFNLGLKAKYEGHVPGVHQLPHWLKRHAFHLIVNPVETLRVDAPLYQTVLDMQSGILNCDDVADFSRKLSLVVRQVLESGHFPVVVGGDCSILIGCALGACQFETCGLFFIDGHTDFISADLSQTKAVAGMDLYLVTGNGHEKLSNLEGKSPYVREENALAFGNRCLEDKYVDCIRQSQIDYVDLQSVKMLGPATVVNRFRNRLSGNGVAHYWIHLDVDVLENSLMPAVDSPQPGGLSYPELTATLKYLLSSPAALGISISILDPDLDPDGRYTERFVQEIGPVVKSG